MLPKEPLPDSERFWLGRYPACVPAHIRIPDGMLHEVVGEVARRTPERPALIFEGRSWSYQQFWEASGRFAAALTQDGIAPGDRVALYLPNGPLYPIAFFGTLQAGAIVVQVSPHYLGDDLSALLLDAEPRAIVTLEALGSRLEGIRGRGVPSIAYVASVSDLTPDRERPAPEPLGPLPESLPIAFSSSTGVRAWSEALKSGGPSPQFRGDPSTTVAVFQYTGGTTGRAKAAMLTHRNLLANVAQANTWLFDRRPGEESVLAAIPLTHVYGLTVGLLMALVEGDCVVLQPKPDLHAAFQEIDRHGITQFPGVPALYQAFVRDPKASGYHLRSIRFCLSGSAPLPAEVQRRFEALTGAKLVEGYGLSEASPVTHINPLVGERVAGSIGLPLPDTEVCIADPETGLEQLPLGAVGELCVRGPQVMLGYYRRPEETAEALCNGWLRTGDIARMDGNGYAYIVDRKNDVINVGGFKVYPREVEEVLLAHPGVAEAAVVGVPEETLGEVVLAFIVPKSGTPPAADELIAFVRGRLARYKVPRSIRFKDSLPRSGVQKVLRRLLRGEALAPPTSGERAGAAPL